MMMNSLLDSGITVLISYAHPCFVKANCKFPQLTFGGPSQLLSVYYALCIGLCSRVL